MFSTISLMSALRESLTYDEIVDVQEGKNAILHHEFAIDPNNPPFEREFAVIPLLLRADNLISSHQPNINVLPARIMTILLSVFLLVSVFIFTRYYFGLHQAFFAVILLSFEPNILANNHYVTFDMGFTLFFFLAYCFLLQVLEKPAIKDYILLGFSVGFGLASKVSFLSFFIPGMLVILLMQKKKTSVVWIWEQKYRLLLTIGISIIVLWSTYFFTTDVIIVHREDNTRVSSRLEQYAKIHHNPLLANLLYFGENQKIPLGTYFAMIKNGVVRNSQGNMFFFSGKWYPKKEWYFLLGNILYKTPIALLILFFLPFAIYYLITFKSFPLNKSLQKKLKAITYEKDKRNIIYFSIPIISITCMGSITNLLPLVRYVLPIFPFIAIIASQGVFLLMRQTYGKIVIGLLLFWYIISSLSFFPHFISYRNELISFHKQSALLFIDSNIDWGQSLVDMKEYLAQNKYGTVNFSYFGRDNADGYGLQSDKLYGSYKGPDICEFHKINNNSNTSSITAISISNWYYCGYYEDSKYKKSQIKDIIGNSIIIF